MHLLLVEDTESIAQNIVDYFLIQKHQIDHVVSYTQALSLIKKNHYDCILLDIMLPDGNGIDICRKIKEILPHTSSTAVIMISAKWQIEDKEQAYKAGADDYLVKPFSLKELELRVEAVTRRVIPNDIIYIKFQKKSREIDSTNNTVRCNGITVKLTHKEYLVLITLVEARGAISRSDIVEVIRGGDALFENDAKLDVYIATIRKKLGKEFIETIKGYGYRIGGKIVS